MNIIFEEEKTSGYKERTIKNASADMTIAIAKYFDTAGEKLTYESAKKQGKLYVPVSTDVFSSGKLFSNITDVIAVGLKRIPKSELTVNIAGNGIYTLKGVFTQEQCDKFTSKLLEDVLDKLHFVDETKKIVLIRTGGQTGFDEAGAKAGVKLNIPTYVLSPKNWVFRDEYGIDISSETLFKKRFL